MKVLVCGDRHWNYIKNGMEGDWEWIPDPQNVDRNYLYQKLDDFHAKNNITLIIEGEARGADTIARNWAEARGVPVQRFPALWGKYGTRAGPIRNKQMLDEGKPDAVIAFHRDISNSKGTKNMLLIAQKAGIKHILLFGQSNLETEQLGLSL